MLEACTLSPAAAFGSTCRVVPWIDVQVGEYERTHPCAGRLRAACAAKARSDLKIVAGGPSLAPSPLASRRALACQKPHTAPLGARRGRSAAPRPRRHAKVQVMPEYPIVTLLLALCSSAFGATLHEDAQTDDIEALKSNAATASNINGLNGKGKTALSLAVCNEYSPLEAVKALLEAGADADARDKFGNTALHLVARKACKEDNKEAHKASLKVAKLLLIYGGNVDVPSRGTGWSRDGSTDVTPLHVAADAGNIRILELLLEKGARVDAVDSGGNTALHHAARASRAKTVLSLVKAGADVKLKNGVGKLPMDFATRGTDNFAVEIREHLENARSIRKKAAAENAAAAAKKKATRDAKRAQRAQQGKYSSLRSRAQQGKSEL